MNDWINNEEFQAWRRSVGMDLVIQINAAWEAWQVRQPEIDVLNQEIALLKETGRGVMEVNATLKAEVERLRKDAERYQWLCEEFGVTKLPCAIERIIEGTYVADGKHSIDAAIDAAMKEPK